MKTVYVVMSETTSPIAFNVPSPHCVFGTKQAAVNYANAKNAKAVRLVYFVQTAKWEPTCN